LEKYKIFRYAGSDSLFVFPMLYNFVGIYLLKRANAPRRINLRQEAFVFSGKEFIVQSIYRSIFFLQVFAIVVIVSA
jgi:hypothetical protein